MGFESYHPAINLIYFAGTITAAVLFGQPVFLAISCLCAFAYSVKRGGIRIAILNAALIPLILLFALYYSSYTHFGLTVLQQNFIGNNMTLESLLCGVSLGTTAAAVIMWSSCVFSVFTTDKIVYLFGRISPKLSLCLSILLRMVPRLKAQAKKISTARKAIGRGMDQGNVLRRILNCIKILSMLLTWLFESMATVSDSMRSRGYSLKGRTAFSIYRFDNRDRCLVVVLFTCLTILSVGHLLEQTNIRYDPQVIMNPITPASFLFYLAHLTFCLLPLSLEVWTEHRFQKLRNTVGF